MSEKPPFIDYYGNSLRLPCTEAEPELFFPNSDEIIIEEAKSYCRRCDIMKKCLAWALETKQQGIWGATTDDERKAMRTAQEVAETTPAATKS